MSKKTQIILMPFFREYIDLFRRKKKKIEFRKVTLPDNLRYILVYQCAALKKVVGYMIVKKVVSGTPNEIWVQYQHISGVHRDIYDEYYKGSKKAVGIIIDRYIPFEKPVTLSDIDVHLNAPQSFCYLSENMFAQALEIAEKHRLND
jgi:predicted transcriptional regulator